MALASSWTFNEKYFIEECIHPLHVKASNEMNVRNTCRDKYANLIYDNIEKLKLYVNDDNFIKYNIINYESILFEINRRVSELKEALGLLQRWMEKYPHDTKIDPENTIEVSTDMMADMFDVRYTLAKDQKFIPSEKEFQECLAEQENLIKRHTLNEKNNSASIEVLVKYRQDLNGGQPNKIHNHNPEYFESRFRRT